MDLNELGQEYVKGGRRTDKTCHQLHKQELEYLIYLMQHRSENLKFQNVQIYAADTLRKGPASRPKAAPKKSSGSVPTPIDSEDDWEEMKPVRAVPSTDGAIQTIQTNQEQQDRRLAAMEERAKHP